MNLKERKIFFIILLIVAVLTLLISFLLLIRPAQTQTAEPKCGNPDHLHTAECFDENVEIRYICGLEEHEHTDECYMDKLVCENTDEDHEHTEDCYMKVLICEKEEHIHTGQCIEAVIVEDNSSLVENLFHGEIDSDEVELPSLTIQSSNEPIMLTSSNPNLSLESYVKNVRLQMSTDGQNFTDVTDDTRFYSWDWLKFILEYELPAYTMSKDNKTFTYTIPYNIAILEKAEGPVFNNTGNIVGTYEIDESGVITMDFYEDFAQKNADGEPIYGSIAFSSKLDGSAVGKDGSVTFVFNDEISIDLVIEDKVNKNGDLFVEKSQSNLTDDGFIEYTVKVYSIEGTSEEVYIKDTMSNVVFDSNFEIKDSNGNNIDVSVPNDGSKMFEYSLPKLEANSYYLITYKARLEREFTQSTYIDNNVYTSSKDSDGYDIEARTSIGTNYTVNMVQKTATQTDDGYIEWTININNDKTNIGGYTITDILNDEEFDGKVTLTDENGNSKEITFPYTFADDDTSSYIITYKTASERAPGSNSALNKVILSKNDKEYTSEKSVYLGEAQAPTIEKSGTDIEVDENGDVLLTWHINIVMNDALPVGKEIADFTNNGHYFTASQMSAFLQEIDKLGYSYTYTLYGPNWYPEYTEIGNDNYYMVRIRFDEALPKNTKIEFDYQTTGHIDDLQNAAHFTNNLSVDYRTTSTTLSYTPNIYKYDPDSNDNPSTHTLNSDRLIYWAIDFECLDVPFKVREIIPEYTSIYSVFLNNEMLEYTVDEDGTIIFDFDEDFVNEHKNTKQKLFVTVQIDEDYKWTVDKLIKKGTFENTVNIENENDEVLSTSSHTQIIQKENDEIPIKKFYNGATITDTLPYMLDVNESKKVYNVPQTMVRDVLTYSGNSDYILIYLIPDSVEAFEVLDNGATRKLNSDEFSFTYSYDISNAAGTWGDCSNTLLMNIPDGMHVQIYYNYRINGVPNPNQYYGIKNTSSFSTGVEIIEGEESRINVAIQNSEVFADTQNLEIYKCDENTKRILEGVYFRLYKYNGTDYILQTDDGGEFIQTDADGKLIIKEASYNVAYCLEEVMPLDGYESPDLIYFMIRNDDLENYPEVKPADFEGTVYRKGMPIYIYNYKPVTSVSVDKIWADGNGIVDGTTGDSAKINLIQIKQSDEDFKQNISTQNTVKLNVKAGPSEWETWKEETNEYVNGTNLKLTITYNEHDYEPGPPVIKLGDETLSGSKNAVYIEKQFDWGLGQELQYTTYTYEFTLNGSQDLTIYYNFWQQAKAEYELTATYIPDPGVNNLASVSYKTIILNEENNWSYTWEDLPLLGYENGEIVHYSYEVNEVQVEGYTAEIELVSEDENGKHYIITNKRKTTPVTNMPATGGPGVLPIYALGILIIIYSIYQLLKKNKR